MEEQIISNISSTMDALSEITGFSLVFLIATVFSGFQKSDKIEILGFEIRTQIATVVLFGILCGLTFNLTRLLSIVSYLLSQLDASPRIEEAIIILQTHPWVFNPFSQTSGSLSFLLDNLGLSLLIVAWWLGFHTGFFISRDARLNLSISVTSWILSLFYFGLGLAALMLTIGLINEINPETKWIKISGLFLFTPIGALGLRRIFQELHRLSTQVADAPIES
ncbi:MAG: hypothetical protein AAGD09_21080 [Cyanobacteria bacterium P01_F01_bin.56]